MIRIPSLFQRNTKTWQAEPKINPGAEWVVEGKGFCTIKIDGVHVRVSKAENGAYVLEKRLKSPDWTQPDQYLPLNIDLPENRYFKEAFLNLTGSSLPGEYVAYGFGIKGNPHNLIKSQMIRVEPVDKDLIVNEWQEKLARGKHVGVDVLYGQIYDMLNDDCDVEGLVFQYEEELRIVKAVQVTRKDFGLPWPRVAGLTVIQSGKV